SVLAGRLLVRLLDALGLGVDGLLLRGLCGLRLLRLLGGAVLGIHGLAEALDGLAQIGTQVFQALGAEYQDDYDQDNQPVFPVENAHACKYSSVSFSGRARLSRRGRKARSGAPVRPARPADADRGRQA